MSSERQQARLSRVRHVRRPNQIVHHHYKIGFVHITTPVDGLMAEPCTGCHWSAPSFGAEEREILSIESR